VTAPEDRATEVLDGKRKKKKKRLVGKENRTEKKKNESQTKGDHFKKVKTFQTARTEKRLGCLTSRRTITKDSLRDQKLGKKKTAQSKETSLASRKRQGGGGTKKEPGSCSKLEERLPLGRGKTAS